ncbi:MAG: glycosyltransferase family 39 protein [Deltaproteobacteria bacterium]|nr:glycosyltransferase family 39 protein [Deltaproteobacteria bacterium]
MTESSPREATLRAGPLLGGVALLVIYMRIGATIGFQAWYGPPFAPLHKDVPISFVHVSQSELRFWLAHLALALPGALLVAWGVAPRLAPLVRRLVARIDGATPRGWRIAGAVLFVVLVLWSIAGHYVVLLGQPLTDDENAVTFGARILASGQVSVPLLQPAGAFTDLFTYQRDGQIMSMDFPGVLLFAALGILTKLGPLLYAIACGVSGVAIAYAAGRWFGPRGRVIAALIWLASPMIAALSITVHGHIPSRMFIALAIAFAARLDTDTTTARRDLILLGLFAGLGFLCRPFETACLLGPLGAWFVWKRRTQATWLLAGLVPTIAVFALYNSATTGVWYLQARFAPGTLGNPSLRLSMGDRFATNLGWNVLMLAVFFLGVPAIAAVIGGLQRKRPMLLVLAVGCLTVLLMCLLHDNTGIHSVGPIHMSEVALPLVLLATAGILRAFVWFSERGLSPITPAALLAGYLVIACGAFNLSNLASLRMQANTQGVPLATLEAAGIHNAIVIARPYIVLLQVDKTFAPWGSWVLEYPQPHPDLSDDILWAKWTADPKALRAAFPERAIYRLHYSEKPPVLRVEQLP